MDPRKEKRMRFLRVFAVLWCAASGLLAIAQDDGKPARVDRFNDIDPSALKVDVPSLLLVRTDMAYDWSTVLVSQRAWVWRCLRSGWLDTWNNVVICTDESQWAAVY